MKLRGRPYVDFSNNIATVMYHPARSMISMLEWLCTQFMETEVAIRYSERRKQTMSEQIVQLNEESIKGQLKEFVCKV